MGPLRDPLFRYIRLDDSSLAYYPSDTSVKPKVCINSADSRSVVVVAENYVSKGAGWVASCSHVCVCTVCVQGVIELSGWVDIAPSTEAGSAHASQAFCLRTGSTSHIFQAASDEECHAWMNVRSHVEQQHTALLLWLSPHHDWLFHRRRVRRLQLLIA